MICWAAKCRDGDPTVLPHREIGDEVEVEDNIRGRMEEGYQYVRCQMGNVWRCGDGR